MHTVDARRVLLVSSRYPWPLARTPEAAGKAVNDLTLDIAKHAFSREDFTTARPRSWEPIPTGETIIESARFLEQDTNSMTITPGTPLTLSVRYRVNWPDRDVTFGVILYRTSDQLVVYDGHFTSKELGRDGLPSGAQFGVDFRVRAYLLRGQCHFECHVPHNPTHRFLSRVGLVDSLTVHETRTCAGVVDLEIVPVLKPRVARASIACSGKTCGPALAN